MNGWLEVTAAATAEFEWASNNLVEEYRDENIHRISGLGVQNKENEEEENVKPRSNNKEEVEAGSVAAW